MQNQAGKDLIITWIMKQSIAAENGASGISLSVPGLTPFFSIVPHSCKGAVISPLLNRVIYDCANWGHVVDQPDAFKEAHPRAPHLTQS